MAATSPGWWKKHTLQNPLWFVVQICNETYWSNPKMCLSSHQLERLSWEESPSKWALLKAIFFGSNVFFLLSLSHLRGLCCCPPPCTQHPVVPRCHLSFLPLHQTKQQQSPQEDESLNKLISDTYVRNLWQTNDVQRGKQRGWIQTSQTALGDDAGICFPGVLLLPSAEHGDGHSSPDRQWCSHSPWQCQDCSNWALQEMMGDFPTVLHTHTGLGDNTETIGRWFLVLPVPPNWRDSMQKFG